jgi:hypothetical protein
MPLIIDNSELSFTAGVQASLAPWNDPAGGWQGLNAALGSMFDQVWPLVADQGSPDEPGFTAGWSTLLNPSACPTQFLPYLAQFVGVQVAPGTPDSEARSAVFAEAGFRRGTPAAIIAAAAAQLADATPTLVERTSPTGPDPYHFLLVIPVNSGNPTAITQAVDAVKPAGVQWTLVQANGFVWDTITGSWSQQTITWNNA